MKPAALVGDGYWWGDGFVCEPHSRYWHKVPGYASLAPAALRRNAFRPACIQCLETMYIEFADCHHDLRFRRPACHHYGFGQLPER